MAFVSSGDDSNNDKDEIMKNGKIHTGYYSNWHQLSRKNRELVMAERQKPGKGNKATNNDKVDDKGGKANNKKNPKQWKNKIRSLKRKIASIRKNAQGDASDDESDDTLEPKNNAGNAFGGRAEKAKKNKRNN